MEVRGSGYDNPGFVLSEKDTKKTQDVPAPSPSPSPSPPSTPYQKFFSAKHLKKRFPIYSWLPKYNWDCAVGDLVAGITVGLTVIPQALAIAHVAGLPPQYGLYTSFLGCFVYIVFGSCKDVAMGPTAIVAILTCQAIRGKGVEYAIMLCFVTGAVQVLMGVFGMGFIIDFVSGPVSSGFTSAFALDIITSLIPDVLGFEASGNTFFNEWSDIIAKIHNTNVWDTLIGIGTLVILALMRILTVVSVENKYLRKTFWLIGTSRNTILVVLSGLLGYYYCSTRDKPPFAVIGVVPAGLPRFQPPPFAGIDTVVNGTRIHTDLGQILSDLGSGLVVVPLVGLLENIATCKVFAQGQTVDATQEFLAIGLSNMANSFVQAFPGSGALCRSAVNNASGVKTPAGGLYTALLVMLSLVFLTPYFYFIPKSTLSAIIIAATVYIVEVKVVLVIWRTKRKDLIPGVAAFISCLLLPLQYGILIGVSISLMGILYHAARPKISIEKLESSSGIEYLVLTPDRSLIFPSVDYVRNVVHKHSTKEIIPVVIDCTHIYRSDYSAAAAIAMIVQNFEKRAQPLFFYNLKDTVQKVFEGCFSMEHLVVYYDKKEIDGLLEKTKLIVLSSQDNLNGSATSNGNKVMVNL